MYKIESQESVQRKDVETSASASPVAQPFLPQVHRRTEVLNDDMDTQSDCSDTLSNDTHQWDWNLIYAMRDPFVNLPGLTVQVK